MEQLLCGQKEKKIKKRQRVNSGSLNLNEESHCSESSHTDNSHFKSLGDSTERDSLYVLKRDSGSFHSRGYLFLAVAFGMMAYNSYTGQDKPSLTSPHIPTVDVPSKNKFSQMRQPLCADVDLMDDQMQNMNLVSSDVGDSFIPESQLQDSPQVNTDLPVEEDEAVEQSQFATAKVTPEQMILQGNISQMLKSLIHGKYHYLTYLMSSTACIYFWLAPNHHKMQLIKPVARVVRHPSTVGKPKYKSS